MSVVTVEKNRYTVTPIKQWDVNHVLEIRGLSLPKTPEIHFTNEAMVAALPRSAKMDEAGVITVTVPDSLLQKPYRVIAYVCIVGEGSFETLYKIEIPVEARKMPADYTIADGEEVYSFRDMERRFDEAYNLLLVATEKIGDYEIELAEYKAAAESYEGEVETLHNEFAEVSKDFTDATKNYNDAKAAYDEAVEVLGRLEVL